MGGILDAIASYNPQGMALQNQLRQAQIQGEQAQTQLQGQQAQAVGLENYRRQIENRDMGILGDAFRAANGDPTKAIPIAMNNGLSPIGYFKYQGEANSQAQQLLALSKTQREEMDARTHDMGDQLEALKAMPQTQRADAASSAIANYQKLYPGVAVDPNDFTTDAGLTKLTVPLNYWKYHLANAKTQAETGKEVAQTGQAQAETTKLQQEADSYRRTQAAQELEASIDPSTGAIDPARIQAINSKYKLGVGASPQEVDQFITSTIAPDKVPEYMMNRAKAREMTQFMAHPEQAGAQIDSILPPQRFPDMNRATKTEVAASIGRGDFEGAKAAIAAAREYAGRVAYATDRGVIGAEIGKAYATAKALEPLEIDKAVKTDIARAKNSPEMFAGITDPVSRRKAQDDWGKANEDALNKVTDSRQLRDFIAAAQSGNKSAPGMIPIEQVRSLVNRVNRTELESVSSGAGSALDRVQGFFNKEYKGQPIPPDILRDSAKLAALQEQNAIQKRDLNMKLLGAKYGAPNLRGMDFGQYMPATAPPMPSQLSQADVGKTYTNRDGKRVTITGVNPQDPTSFRGNIID